MPQSQEEIKKNEAALDKFKMSAFDLTGKVAIITGGNTGLGQGYAVALAEAGADIFVAGTSSIYAKGGSFEENIARLREAIR